MKITLSLPLLVTILALALAGAPTTAQAQTSTTTPAATPKPADAAPYAGTITAIDGTSVTVATDSGTLTLAITPTTKIARGKGVNGKMSDFAVGDKVKGRYTTDASGAKSATKFYKTGPTAAPDAK